jgi:hypothetical protein
MCIFFIATTAALGAVYTHVFASDSLSDSPSDFMRHENQAYTHTHDFASDSARLQFAVARAVVCFPKFGTFRKFLFINNFANRGWLVSDVKSDRESEGHPICMQIGQRIGCRIVRVYRRPLRGGMSPCSARDSSFFLCSTTTSRFRCVCVWPYLDLGGRRGVYTLPGAV